jgi:predicted AAA+ superfamily ATPase
MTRQIERTLVALQRQQITQLPVLYQYLKGKAHGYFIFTQAQRSSKSLEHPNSSIA